MHMTESLAFMNLCLQWGFDEIIPGKETRHCALRSHHSGFVQCLVNIKEGVADLLRVLESLPRKDGVQARAQRTEYEFPGWRLLGKSNSCRDNIYPVEKILNHSFCSDMFVVFSTQHAWLYLQPLPPASKGSAFSGTMFT